MPAVASLDVSIQDGNGLRLKYVAALVGDDGSEFRDGGRRVFFMDGGQILEQNEPHTFFSSPQNERLKDFLAKVL